MKIFKWHWQRHKWDDIFWINFQVSTFKLSFIPYFTSHGKDLVRYSDIHSIFTKLESTHDLCFYKITFLPLESFSCNENVSTDNKEHAVSLWRGNGWKISEKQYKSTYDTEKWNKQMQLTLLYKSWIFHIKFQ